MGQSVENRREESRLTKAFYCLRNFDIFRVVFTSVWAGNWTTDPIRVEYLVILKKEK